MGRSSSRRRDKDGDEKKSKKKSRDSKKKHKKTSSREEEKTRSRKSSSKDRHGHHSNKHEKDRSKSSSKNISSSSSRALPSKNLIPLGDPLGHAPDRLLNASEDYFAFHEHLFVYLYRHEGRAFNDLTSEETHQAFEQFCNDYNAGRLSATYYQETMPADIIAECQTTRHKWKFQISHDEDKSLRNLSLGIKSQTEYTAKSSAATGERGENQGLVNVNSESRSAARHDATAREQQGDRRSAEDRYQERLINKRLKQHVQTVHDELTGGRPDHGRERQMEKRKEVAARTHGASRDRDDNAAAVELTDDALFGADDNTQGFQAALQREKLHRAKRQDQQNQRLEELRQKEDERKADMMRKLGLAPGQKITIQPRNDG